MPMTPAATETATSENSSGASAAGKKLLSHAGMLMKPPTRERSANTASGMVIDGGDSCGCSWPRYSPENVEGRHAGSDGADPIHPRRAMVGGNENQILAEESGGIRETGDGDGGEH